MNDRMIGYGVIFFLTVFLLFPITYFSVKFFAPVHRRTIVFENVNTLSFLHPEDPVKIRGIDVGMIRFIYWKQNKTYVEVETRSEILVRSGYHIVAEDKGLMGDRFIAIFPGDSTAAPVDKNAVLHGYYLLGPTEAIAYMDRLRNIADSVSALAAAVRFGSPGKAPLAAQFSMVVKSLDTITISFSRILRKVDLAAGKALDTLAKVTEKTHTIADGLSVSVPRTVIKLESLIARSGKLCADVDSLIASSSKLANRLNGREAAELTERFRRLKHQMTMIKDAVNELKEDGATIPVRLW